MRGSMPPPQPQTCNVYLLRFQAVLFADCCLENELTDNTVLTLAEGRCDGSCALHRRMSSQTSCADHTRRFQPHLKSWITKSWHVRCCPAAAHYYGPAVQRGGNVFVRTCGQSSGTRGGGSLPRIDGMDPVTISSSTTPKLCRFEWTKLVSTWCLPSACLEKRHCICQSPRWHSTSRMMHKSLRLRSPRCQMQACSGRPAASPALHRHSNNSSRLA